MTQPNTPHPYAAILRAIADGKEIQVCSTTVKPSLWEDCTATFCLNRIESGAKEFYDFRIKPETKTIWVLFYHALGDGADYTRAYGAANKDAVYAFIANTPHITPKGIREISYTPGEGLDA